MTRIILGSRRTVPKDEVAKKGAQRHRNHDPAIIRHEYEPAQEM